MSASKYRTAHPAADRTLRCAIAICLAALAALASSSCVSSKPVHYYSIQPPPSPAPQSKPGGVVLLVGNISTAEALQDSRIRYRIGANEAGAYEFNRWTERPGAMVRISLVRALRATGQYQRVLEASGSAAGDYQLRGKLYEFGEVDAGSVQTRISLQVELVDMKTNANVWDHLTERDEPVKSKTVADVVQSLDRNLQQVVNETTAELGKFLAAQK